LNTNSTIAALAWPSLTWSASAAGAARNGAAVLAYSYVSGNDRAVPASAATTAAARATTRQTISTSPTIAAGDGAKGIRYAARTGPIAVKATPATARAASGPVRAVLAVLAAYRPSEPASGCTVATGSSCSTTRATAAAAGDNSAVSPRITGESSAPSAGCDSAAAATAVRQHRLGCRQ